MERLVMPVVGNVNGLAIVTGGVLVDVDRVLELLRDANQVLRMSYAIAQRNGDATNWGSFQCSLKKVLDDQFAWMFPQMSAEEADKAYDEAPSIPMSDDEIERLVSVVTKRDRRKWIPWSDECCECGSEVEVFTVSDVGAYDGDDVRCRECNQTGYVSADEEGCHTVWHET